jgi:hypothetical protein
MKTIQLNVMNRNDSSWIILEKEDDLPLLLPVGTIFEAVENYRGKVINHYYNDKDSTFITNIVVESVLHFQLGYFKETLLKNGWVIRHEDSELMLRDKCE